MSEGYVYLAGYCEGLVKIGFSGDPSVRIRSLRSKSKTPSLSILWSTPGSYHLESGLHRVFDQYHRHGEWFDFGDLDPRTEIDREVKRLVFGSNYREPTRVEYEPVSLADLDGSEEGVHNDGKGNFYFVKKYYD